MNQGYHPGTATKVQLSADAAFLFHAHTAGDARGRGWMPRVLDAAATDLASEHGVRAMVTTTEQINRPARAMFAKAGFRDVGGYCRYGFAGWSGGWYPTYGAPIIAIG